MITAETDRDAVEFYWSSGFKVTSLGEKYPGVERFLCELKHSWKFRWITYSGKVAAEIASSAASLYGVSVYSFILLFWI